MRDTQDTLRVTTSENVGIGYRVAGLATRLIAAAIDGAILVLLLLVAYLLVYFLVTALSGGLTASTLTLILISAVEFFVVVLYFTIAEAVTGGRTPGKSAMGIRVIRSDGGAPDLASCFLRNLAYIVDVGLFLGPILMFFHPEGRRAGDLVAGTVVAGDRPAVSFAEVMTPPPVYLRSPDPGPPIEGVGRLGERDFSAVRTLLSRPGLTPQRRAELAGRIAGRLVAKMQLPAAAPELQLPPEMLLERIYLQLTPQHGP